MKSDAEKGLGLIRLLERQGSLCADCGDTLISEKGNRGYCGKCHDRRLSEEQMRMTLPISKKDIFEDVKDIEERFWENKTTGKKTLLVLSWRSGDSIADLKIEKQWQGRPVTHGENFSKDAEYLPKVYINHYSQHKRAAKLGRLE